MMIFNHEEDTLNDNEQLRTLSAGKYENNLLLYHFIPKFKDSRKLLEIYPPGKVEQDNKVSDYKN